MALAESAALAVKLTLDDRGFSGPLKKVKGQLAGLGKGAAVAAGAAATIATGLIVKNVQSGLANLAALESAVSSVDGAIKQAGLTGKLTGAQVAGWANEIEASIGAAFDDKEITAAATTLLRFGKVTPKNLKPALVVMTDLATKTGSVDSAASLLAKAMADPTKAAGKLARAGVILTKAQQDQIKAMVKAGDTAGAQALLLSALEQATKGAAAASQGPYARSQKVLADVTEDAQKALAEGFLPVIEKVRDILSRELAKPSTIENLRAFGKSLAGALDKAVNFAAGVDWGAIADAAKSVAGFGKSIAEGFLNLPPEAKGILLSLAALNKLSGGAVIKVGVDLFQGAASTLFQQFLGKGSPANPMFVVPVGGGLGGGVPGVAPAGGKLAGAASLVGKVFMVGMAAEAASMISGPLQQLGKDIGSQLPLAKERGDLGTAITSLQWPFGPKGAPAWASGNLPTIKVSETMNRTTGGLSPEDRQILSDQKRAIIDAKLAQVTAAMGIKGAVTSGNAGIRGAVKALDLHPRIVVNVKNSVSVRSIIRGTGVTSSYSTGHIGATLGM